MQEWYFMVSGVNFEIVYDVHGYVSVKIPQNQFALNNSTFSYNRSIPLQFFHSRTIDFYLRIGYTFQTQNNREFLTQHPLCTYFSYF